MILSCYFPEDGYEMYTVLVRMCWAIFLLIGSFALPHPCFRRRRGLLKVPIVKRMGTWATENITTNDNIRYHLTVVYFPFARELLPQSFFFQNFHTSENKSCSNVHNNSPYMTYRWQGAEMTLGSRLYLCRMSVVFREVNALRCEPWFCFQIMLFFWNMRV